jgi:prophage maintenance system killer protein
VSEERDQVVLYQAPDGAVTLDVRLEDESVWLTQKQMAVLFNTERSVITKHMRNIFATKELEEESNVQKMHIAFSDKPAKFYNLDVIISVGYRVNSKRGTQFRIWATKVLRDHVVRGYSLNERRLQELNQAIRLIGEVVKRKALNTDEATALLSVVKDYSYALDLLDDYDHERVTASDITVRPVAPVSYDEARRIIERLRAQFNAGDIFGAEKDKSLQGSLANIMQTFDGKELYPSLEEKASQLLYSLVKNHSFVDGNKRIAAALFLWFLEKNVALYGTDGSKRIADNALVAMTLLIAESRPTEKNVLTRVVVNLINRRNQ